MTVSPRFRVIIPARYASTRLPGKPLLEIAGRPMLQHVWERARESGAEEVVIATDDERIRTVAEGFGARVIMTAASHRSGTDRLAEAAEQLGCAAGDVIVNVQGDEPQMPPENVAQVAANLERHGDAGVATLCEPIRTAEELFNPNVVKVVFDHAGYALYFSRAPIPWERDAFAAEPGALPEGTGHYRHLGIYAYRAGFLREYVTWPGCALEHSEALEQLRVLWQGRRIHVAEARMRPPAGVDTEADLERVRRALA